MKLTEDQVKERAHRDIWQEIFKITGEEKVQNNKY